MEVIGKKEYEGILSALEALRSDVERLKKYRIKWVSRFQAAEIMHKNPETVSRMAKRGAIKSRKEGGSIEFDIDSIIEYQNKFTIERVTT